MDADLHLHSSCSDGVLAPRDLAWRCHARGIRCIALTDHDSWLQNELLAAAELPPELLWIPGIELSTHDAVTGLDLHVLGYSLVPDRGFSELLTRVSAARRSRVAAIAEALVSIHVHLDVAAVLARGETPGKPDIARIALAEPANAEVLGRDGVDDVGSFIRVYLERGKPAHVPKHKLETTEAIDVICRCGGRAVWAHPALDLRGFGDPVARLQVLESLLDRLRRRGLSGVETFNFCHEPDEVELLDRLARAHGLRRTAGSDFHDESDPSTGRLLVGYDQDVSWLIG